MNIKKKISVALWGVALLFLCLPQAGMAASNSLITVDWLAKNLHKQGMVILDVITFIYY